MSKPREWTEKEIGALPKDDQERVRKAIAKRKRQKERSHGKDSKVEA